LKIAGRVGIEFSSSYQQCCIRKLQHNRFTTQDVRRCQILARTIAVIYNWWSFFTRLAIPSRHTEAITSRPLLLNGVARQTTHSNQTMLTITSMHAQAPAVRHALQAVSAFLQ
jgi:hypothetical protein